MKLKGLYQKTDTGIFYYQPPMAKGVRPAAISLGTKIESEAVAQYHEVATDAANQFQRGSFRMEAARYISEQRASGIHREQTAAETEWLLTRVIRDIGNRAVDLYTTDDLARLRDKWKDAGLSAATIAGYFGRLSGFFAWATKEKLIPANPVKTLKLQRRLPTRAEKYCTREQRDHLIGSISPDRHDLALCLWLGFFAGLRKNEIIEARRDWVDLASGVLHVKNTDTSETKNRRERIIRLSGRLAAFLTKYLELVPEVPGSPYLLRPDRLPGKKAKARGKVAWRYRYDPRTAFENHVRAQDLEWVTFHVMRHTWATLHAIGGTPIAVIAKELGDEIGTTFDHYVGFTKGGDHASVVD
jgi:integrase